MNETLNSTAQDLKIKRRGQLYGLILISVIAIPMLAAYFIYKTGFGFPTGTTNKGELLTPPVLLSNLIVNDDAAFETLFSGENKRWRMLVPVTRDCESVCESYLYLSRQVHVRLANKAYRVERILLLLDELSPEQLEKLNQEHPETRLIQSKKENLSAWLSEQKLQASADQYFYLVDQEGFAMMRYDQSHSGQDVLDDVKKLLKFTYDK